MIEWEHILSVNRQCDLLGLSKGSLYYIAKGESAENLELMDKLDQQYLVTPFYGSRRMSAWLNTEGYSVNRKRVQRLMRLMGMEAIYPKPKTTLASLKHKKFPYLLRGVSIHSPDHVWSTDITYVRVQQGFFYLSAIIDWYSRYVLAWKLSNSLDSKFCIENLEEALSLGKPKIFNTDQGVQYTSTSYTQILEKEGIQVSMDGKGRAIDNIFVERLWRSIKYEEIYLKQYEDGDQAYEGIKNYFRFYNEKRLHQSLGYQTPEYVYFKNSERMVSKIYKLS